MQYIKLIFGNIEIVEETEISKELKKILSENL